MRIGIYLSSRGGSPLQIGLQRGLHYMGHQTEQFHPDRHYDLILIFNQTAHTTDYSYPEFPRDNTPIAFVDSAEYGYFKRLPGVANDYKNTFSDGSLYHDTKNTDEQIKLMRFLEGRSFPYFLREHLKFIEFPAEYHPIDYPLYESSACHQAPNLDEYLSRTLDLFMYWGGSHPWRLDITQALRDCHTCCEITIIDDQTAPRLPQHQYFDGTRRAKCSVSFDGYGSSSFRLTEVLVRCLLLRAPLSIRRYMDLQDGVNCLEYEVKTDGENFVSTNACSVLCKALKDPEGSFELYQAGYHHCMDHYTEKATAMYLMDVIERHDWSKPTSIRI